MRPHQLKGALLPSDRNAVAETSSGSVAEDLQVLEIKLKQAKLEYEQYFLGSRPREPVLLRGEVQKLIVRYSNQPIQNTKLRFKFNSLCARFFAFRRHWDSVLRQMEEGTYQRQVFRAGLRERPALEERPRSKRADARDDLFEEYLSARRSCGEDVSGLTRNRLDKLLGQQERAIRERYACEDVRFRVVVENGRTKLKATPVGRKRGTQ